MSHDFPSDPRTPQRRGMFAAALLCAALLVGFCPAANATFNNTTPRGSFAGNINYVVTGATIRTANDTTNACAVTNGNVTGAITVPSGATIQAVYLYWGGSGPTIDTTVSIDGTAVTADATDTATDSSGVTLTWFWGFKDITALNASNGWITASGSATTVTFSGLTVVTTDQGANTYCTTDAVGGGYSVVVIYSLASENNRVINVYDGIQNFRGSSITTTPNNFQIPAAPINGKMTVLTWEGDAGNSGALGGFNEALTFNGATLTDTCNPTNNQYNSTINTLICTGTAATDDVFYGVDLDTYDISTHISSGQTSATVVYSSGADLVYLSAEIISTTNTNVSDLAITKSHVGNFVYGGNAVWTLAVKNNGPNATAGTTTVTDTLATGLTYVSATGTNWTCGAAGQVVTCTNTTAIANGGSYPNITLTASIGATTVTPNSNTTHVDGTNFDNHSSNDDSTDSATILRPDLSTSTKTVVNLNGGDNDVGNVLEYTVTLIETNGAAANNVSVTDNIPANMTGFTVVSFPGGATNSSTGGGGTNGTGFLNVTGISVPASGSVTIVFDVTIGAGWATCASIDNTATVTSPSSSPTTATPTAPTLTVNQTSCASSGSKILYVYDNTTAGFNAALSRIPQPANTGTAITVAANGTQDFTLTPALAKNLKFANSPDVGNVTMTVTLVETATGGSAGTNRPTVVDLRSGAGGATLIASSGTVNVANGPTAFTYTITVPQDTVVTAGTPLILRLHNNNATRTISFSQKTAGQGASTASFNTPTVINVDSVAVTPASPDVPNNNLTVTAVISDPFGFADVDPATGGTAPKVTLIDHTGAIQVNAQAMTFSSSTASTKTFTYTAYTLPASPSLGNWTASVTALEGTEGTVRHTGNTAFDVEQPEPLIMKSVTVSADPTGDAIPHAVPGATMLYSIKVYNVGKGPIDSGAVVLTDPIPANTVMNLSATPPMTFTDGAPTSGLSITAGTDASIKYTTAAGGSSGFGYVPGCTRPCTDATITGIQITLNGKMNASTSAYGVTAGAPFFTISFTVKIN